MVSLKLQIGPSFFLPEERNGFIVTRERKRIWAVELDLLNEFATICEQHRLKWFVHAGTMLGAVRHQGFIPWDDDIDVVMPRKDYEKLCTIAPASFHHPYFFQNGETDPWFAKNFSRLRNSLTTGIVKNFISRKYPFNQGIYIDIFPFDSIPDRKEQRDKLFDELTRLNNEAWYYMDVVHHYHPRKQLPFAKQIKYFIKHLFFKFVLQKQDEYKLKMKQHYSLVTKYDQIDTKYVCESIVPPLGRWIWKKEWVNNVIYMPFEMLSVPVPVGFSECLESGFGKDWMVPKQIGSLHGSILFDVEKPYTEYLRKG